MLEVEPKIKARLDKVIGIFVLCRSKGFRKIGMERPVTHANCRLEKEAVIKEFKLVTGIEVQIQGVAVTNLFVVLIQVFFKGI